MLSAIDRIFSTKNLGHGEPTCPDGTFAAGYMRDSWEQWRVVCLAMLSVEKNRRSLHSWNHDNGVSADWIRYCPGVSENSEVGDSGPKPQAARHELPVACSP